MHSLPVGIIFHTNFAQSRVDFGKMQIVKLYIEVVGLKKHIYTHVNCCTKSTVLGERGIQNIV